ncbi:2-polyprenyl-6-methoxyphenol hydroxylase-like FAD-dependent oxidoreductase [Paenibacillus sp. SORGH_AS306]|uniref:FAD-dependent monooxygenase n=1 Tax=unclassified Paenibacillus TaxID=185978 RepID=UPI00277FB707|nr:MULTISPECIES: FAD-dependent monooxygenase [unclassified Paenibacillus]MDQ1233636.1 2-polyprenyl-6-methoxyphenol hydroxylase-like FAD-dependent oxidoreductase [Paenibacillus sp. SORGH_AS_0306]MDR6110678.1 2-polyprenyl-6-methoxyphenol hydroxylase-like FAD-dependent oxidoreductase [Paenibacillus sp. SORGH_AS_0338]
MDTLFSSVDVLIVGAGPTGLTLACDLARRHINHRIIDKNSVYNVASRSKAIQPRSLEVVDDLEAIDYILDTGVVDLPVRYHTPDGKSIDKPSITVAVSSKFETPYRNPVWIAQFDVEKALRDRYAVLGGQVELGGEALNLVQDLNGVTVTVKTSQGEEQIHARYVVGADGGKSNIRKFIQFPLVGETYDDERWYLGDIQLEGLDHDHIHIWTSSEGMLGLTPLPQSNIWQLQATISTEIQNPVEPSLEMYQAMLDQRAGAGLVEITHASWLSIYRVNVRMVECYHNNRVFLAGDAAHVHSPAGGQGMNTGIQDAYNLGWKLAAVLQGADATLLHTYDEERRPIAQAVLQDSSKKIKAITSTVTESRSLSQSLSTVSDDLTSGLPISYRSSSLTRSFNGKDTLLLLPGDRAPNADILQNKEFSGNIFDLLRGTHWTVLAFVNHTDSSVLENLTHDQLRLYCILPSDTKRTDHIIDHAGNAYRIYNILSEELLLIRPDGYIALRTSIEESSSILQYLNSIYCSHTPVK